MHHELREDLVQRYAKRLHVHVLEDETKQEPHLCLARVEHKPHLVVLARRVLLGVLVVDDGAELHLQVALLEGVPVVGLEGCHPAIAALVASVDVEDQGDARDLEGTAAVHEVDHKVRLSAARRLPNGHLFEAARENLLGNRQRRTVSRVGHVHTGGGQSSSPYRRAR
jgi:hypothetical protein